MTPERIRELKQISCLLYDDLLDKMGTHKYGHVFAGKEETIVLAEIAKKLQSDLSEWIIKDLSED